MTPTLGAGVGGRFAAGGQALEAGPGVGPGSGEDEDELLLVGICGVVTAGVSGAGLTHVVVLLRPKEPDFTKPKLVPSCDVQLFDLERGR